MGAPGCAGLGGSFPAPTPHHPASVRRFSLHPLSPRLSLLFCCSCFGNGFLCFIWDWNPGFIFGDALGGGEVSEFWRAPSTAYPASGSPGLTFRSVSDRIKVKVFACSGPSVNTSCLEAGSCATNGMQVLEV